MGFLSGLGKFIHTVTGWADKITSFIKKPVASLVKLIQGPLDSLIHKFPFGLGKIAQRFVDTFLSKGSNWLASGPVAGLFGFLKKLTPTIEMIERILDAVDRALNGGKPSGHPPPPGGGGGGIRHLPQPALQNAQDIFSWTHARQMLA